MATRTLKVGSTSQIITVTVRDSTGALKTAIAYGSVTYSYTREGDNARANGTCVSASLDAYTDHGWVEISAANQPGKYQFGIPNAMIAAGAVKATITLRAAGAIDQVEHALLTVADLQDGVHLGLTAVPAVAIGSAGALLIQGTGTAAVDVTGGVVKANLVQIMGTALTETAGYLAAGFKKLFNVAAPTMDMTNVNATGDAFALLGAPAGASVSADIAAIKANAVRLLGLSGHNVATTETQVGGVITAIELRMYDTAAHATTDDGSTGLIAKYEVTNTYSAGLIATSKSLQSV